MGGLIFDQIKTGNKATYELHRSIQIVFINKNAEK
jgi:hypothetical protein